jgi:hypothetical protein
MMPRAVERFYKMALNWPDDPKVADLFRFGAVEGVLARDLFNQMIRYSRANLTDGVGPGVILAGLMSPLPEDRTCQLAAYLADPGSWGPLVELSTDEATGRIVSWRVLAYAKWNDTKAEVEARIEHGRTAAESRWNGGAHDRRK